MWFIVIAIYMKQCKSNTDAKRISYLKNKKHSVILKRAQTVGKRWESNLTHVTQPFAKTEDHHQGWKMNKTAGEQTSLSWEAYVYLEPLSLAMAYDLEDWWDLCKCVSFQATAICLWSSKSFSYRNLFYPFLDLKGLEHQYQIPFPFSDACQQMSFFAFG